MLLKNRFPLGLIWSFLQSICIIITYLIFNNIYRQYDQLQYN